MQCRKVNVPPSWVVKSSEGRALLIRPRLWTRVNEKKKRKEMRSNAFPPLSMQSEIENAAVPSLSRNRLNQVYFFCVQFSPVKEWQSLPSRVMIGK
jgi:hypothetical protein